MLIIWAVGIVCCALSGDVLLEIYTSNCSKIFFTKSSSFCLQWTRFCVKFCICQSVFHPLWLPIWYFKDSEVVKNTLIAVAISPSLCHLNYRDDNIIFDNTSLNLWYFGMSGCFVGQLQVILFSHW